MLGMIHASSNMKPYCASLRSSCHYEMETGVVHPFAQVEAVCVLALHA
jgi:hypothetical protein